VLAEALKRVGYIYILNKLLIVFLVYLARDVLSPLLPASVDHYHHNVLLDSLVHWDAGWFLRIAGQGYDFDSAPFFPMFPFLIRLLTVLTNDGVVAGFLISNISLFIACWFLYLIVREDHDEHTAMTTVFIMLFFPTAIFLSSIYSESPFLAFILGTFYFARKKNWIFAIALGICATLTRNLGVVVFFSLLYYQYKDNGYKIDIRKSLPLLLIPASILIFMALLWKFTGDPLAFANSLNREYWGFRHFKYPGAGQLLNLSVFYMNSNFYSLFESGMAFLFLFLVIRAFKYVEDKALLIFLVLGFLIPFSSVVDNKPLGMPRYIIVLFPGYIALARMLYKNNIVVVYSIISVFVFSVISVLFVAGRWIS